MQRTVSNWAQDFSKSLTCMGNSWDGWPRDVLLVKSSLQMRLHTPRMDSNSYFLFLQKQFLLSFVINRAIVSFIITNFSVFSGNKLCQVLPLNQPCGDELIHKHKSLKNSNAILLLYRTPGASSRGNTVHYTYAVMWVVGSVSFSLRNMCWIHPNEIH